MEFENPFNVEDVIELLARNRDAHGYKGMRIKTVASRLGMDIKLDYMTRMRILRDLWQHPNLGPTPDGRSDIKFVPEDEVKKEEEVSQRETSITDSRQAYIQQMNEDLYYMIFTTEAFADKPLDNGYVHPFYPVKYEAIVGGTTYEVDVTLWVGDHKFDARKVSVKMEIQLPNHATVIARVNDVQDILPCLEKLVPALLSVTEEYGCDFTVSR
jgi:hypothetical protein